MRKTSDRDGDRGAAPFTVIRETVWCWTTRLPARGKGEAADRCRSQQRKFDSKATGLGEIEEEARGEERRWVGVGSRGSPGMAWLIKKRQKM